MDLAAELYQMNQRSCYLSIIFHFPSVPSPSRHPLSSVCWRSPYQHWSTLIPLRRWSSFQAVESWKGLYSDCSTLTYRQIPRFCRPLTRLRSYINLGSGLVRYWIWPLTTQESLARAHRLGLRTQNRSKLLAQGWQSDGPRISLGNYPFDSNAGSDGIVAQV